MGISFYGQSSERKFLMYKQILALATILAIMLPTNITYASQNEVHWLSGGDPSFKLIKNSLPDSSLKRCIENTKITTVAEDKKSGRKEKHHKTCATFTPGGFFDLSQSLFAKVDSKIYGDVRLASNTQILVVPIEGTDTVTYSSGNPLYGRYKNVIKNFSTSLDTRINPNGTITHTVKPETRILTLKDPVGDAINFSNIHASSNGKWLIGNAHMRGFFRLNLESGESLIYSPGYNHGVGMSPKPKSAISNSGRYSLDTEDVYGIFSLRDLNSCTPDSDPKKPATCQGIYLNNLAKSKISGFKKVEKATFITENSIQLHIRLTDNSLSLYTMSAPGYKDASTGYIALGDSFASGEGAYKYRPETNSSNNLCHVSNLSYPYLLNPSSNSVACSGAKIKDIINSNYHEGEAQAKGKNDQSYDQDIFYNYLPGYRPQIDFINKYKPKTTTVSIGGNDIGFGKILVECIKPGTCYQDPQDRLNLEQTIDSKQQLLINTFSELKYQSPPDGNVYVIGYPSLAKEGGNCGLNVLLNNDEIAFSNKIIDYLNFVIKSAAEKTGVTYIDVTNVFSGHRMCENSDDSKVAVNGATLGDNRTFSIPISGIKIEGHFTGSESYHPNELGHKLLAKAINNQSNNLEDKNPEPSSESLSTNPTELVQEEESQNLTPFTIDFRDSVSQTITTIRRGLLIQTSGLIPNSAANFSIGSHSEEIMSDSAGILNKQVSLPESMDLGLHTLRINTKNNSGDNISIQKLIIVVGEEDLTNEEKLNSQVPCVAKFINGELCNLLPKSNINHVRPTVSEQKILSATKTLASTSLPRVASINHPVTRAHHSVSLSSFLQKLSQPNKINEIKATNRQPKIASSLKHQKNIRLPLVLITGTILISLILYSNRIFFRRHRE